MKDQNPSNEPNSNISRNYTSVDHIASNKDKPIWILIKPEIVQGMSLLDIDRIIRYKCAKESSELDCRRFAKYLKEITSSNQANNNAMR